MSVNTLDRIAGEADAGPRSAPVVRRIVVHDYAGHAFPVQLSRWLAGRGHTVRHLYCSDVEAPRGRLSRAAADPAGLGIEAVTIGKPIAKYDFARRWLQERDYGGVLGRRIAALRPDVVLSGNTPPAVQLRLVQALRRQGVPLVAWVQDIFSPGVREITRRWPAPLRQLACRWVEHTEFAALRAAAGLVVISPDFVPVLEHYGLRHPECAVIENWAPAGEIAAAPKDNPWARRHGLADRFVFLFSGTLGMKHNPAMLVDLAEAFADDPEVRVVVASQGLGRQYLEEAKAQRGLDNMALLDFQPYDTLSDSLAAADVAVVLLEPFAGGLSVPSKVYSYFCAERAILGAIPSANLARRLIEREAAGLCVDPNDTEAFVAAARRLRQDAALRASCGGRQAQYAAKAFAMDRIGPRFESVLDKACGDVRAPCFNRPAS